MSSVKGYWVPWPLCSDSTNSAVFPALFYLVLILELLDNFNWRRLKREICNGLKSVLIRSPCKVPWTMKKGCRRWEGVQGKAFHCISSPNFRWYHPCCPYHYPTNFTEHKETKWGLALTWWNHSSQRLFISGNKALAVYLQLYHAKAQLVNKHLGLQQIVHFSSVK